MFCRNCGSELKNTDQFCCNCGFSAGDPPPVYVPAAPKKKLSAIQITILAMSAVLVLVILVCVITMATSGIFSPQKLSTEPAVLDALPVDTEPKNPIPEGNPYRQCYNTTEYILAESDKRYYAPAELSQLTDEELLVAQAEISARHGQTVTDPTLREYFDSLSWYTPGTVAKLNTYEEENLFLIDVCLRLRDGSLYRSSNPYMGYLDQSTYVLPNSDTRSVSGNELNRMSTTELSLARNEIYARHGYIFQDSTLKEYFCTKDWYQPTTLAKDFSDTVFTDTETINMDMIALYEDIAGGVYLSSSNPYAHIKNYTYNGYLFPNSSSYLLSYQDIGWMNPAELIIARNEIFARNGYCFTDDDLMAYFLSCSWYLPQVPPGRLDMVSLNSIERQNVNFLLEYQNYLEDAQNGSSSQDNWSSS